MKKVPLARRLGAAALAVQACVVARPVVRPAPPLVAAVALASSVPTARAAFAQAPVAPEPRARVVGPAPTPPTARLRYAAHSLPDRFARAEPYAVGDWVVLVSARAIAVFEDPRANAPARVVRNPFRRDEDSAPWMVSVGRHEVLGSDGRAAVLLDLASGRVRWRTPLPGLFTTTPIAVASSGSTVAASIAFEPESGRALRSWREAPVRPVYVAFDRANGVVRWRSIARSVCAHGPSQTVFLTPDADRLEARALDTGAVRWHAVSRPGWGPSPEFCDGSTLWVRRADWLVGLESSGAQRWLARLGHVTPDSFAAADEGACFAVYGRGDGLAVECRASLDGALRWAREVARRGATPHVALQSANDRVFVEGADGVLRVLDGRTGVERWHWGMGAVARYAVVEGGRVLVAGDARGRVWRFVETERSDEESPVQRVRVTVHLEASAGFDPLERPVLVNGVPVPVPAGFEAQRAGFSATVETRGLVEIMADGGSTAQGNYQARAVLRVDGRAEPYVVRLRLREHMGRGL